jgi:SAM-dependent methyltransferase
MPDPKKSAKPLAKPKASEKPKVKCRICQKPLISYPMGEKAGYKFIACKACGSVMADPYITREELDAFYGQVQPTITHLPDPDERTEIFEGIIRKIVKDPSGKRFLDVKARQGYAVAAAKRVGMNAMGIDPHDFFYKFEKSVYGPEMFQHISAQDYADKDHAKADVVFSLEGFCEQPDPDSFAAALARLVAPNGIIYLQEADGNHFNLPKKFTEWPYVDPPYNFLYISKKGMTTLLARHGLTVQKMYFTWRTIMRLIAVRQ